MTTLYLDCAMGAAGDMLAGALLELLPDPEAAVRAFNGFGIPGVAFARTRVEKCGLAATHLSVTVHGREEHEHAHDHDQHAHDHDHHEHAHHAHRQLADVTIRNEGDFQEAAAALARVLKERYHA